MSIFATNGGYSRTPPHMASASVVALAALFAASVMAANEPPGPGETQSGLEEVLPPVAQDEMLSDAQIRYCLAQSIRIEAIRPGLDRYKAEQVAHFNAVVADFNGRCGRYRYEAGALERVKAQVAASRAQIESDARDAFVKRFAGEAAASKQPPPTPPAAQTRAEPPPTPPAAQIRAEPPPTPPAAQIRAEPPPTPPAAQIRAEPPPTPPAAQPREEPPPTLPAAQTRAEPPPTPPALPAAKPPPARREQAARATPPAAPKPPPPVRTEPPAVADTPLERFTKEIRRAGSLVVDEVDYPAVAQGKGWEGSTYIDVRFAAQGYLRSINLAQSSGHDVLDERALKIVRDLTFPDVPAELRGRELTVRVPVVFRSRRPG